MTKKTEKTETELAQAKGEEISVSRRELRGASADLETLSGAAMEAGMEQLDAGEEILAVAGEAAAVGAAALAMGASDVTRGQDALLVSERAALLSHIVAEAGV